MIPLASFGGFALVALGIVLTPGPNMAYVVSRTVSQGRAAGLLSLGGIAYGLVIYMLLAAFGVTAVILGIPGAYDGLRLAGAAYLAILAWQSLRPNGASLLEVRDMPADSPRKLFTMGLLTCLLNPKVAMLYVALLPQFIHPERGNVMMQTILLGTTQIVIAVIGNALFALCACGLTGLLRDWPVLAVFQRYLMGTVLAVLAALIIVQTVASECV